MFRLHNTEMAIAYLLLQQFYFMLPVQQYFIVLKYLEYCIIDIVFAIYNVYIEHIWPVKYIGWLILQKINHGYTQHNFLCTCFAI